MKGKLHHAAVNSAHFEETVKFFETLFEMEISSTRGEAPHRKLWFREGIQVNEVPQVSAGGNVFDHIGIQVPSREEAISNALALGCVPIEGKGAHWLLTPDNIILELSE